MKARYEMTKKEYLQDLENSVAYGIFTCAKEEFRNESYHSSMRLRTCKAVVYSTDNYYLLKSYETFVAAIEKSTGRIADVLRGEYCYTATSAQHISKFIHDYTSYPWNNDRYTYRDI